MFESDHPQTFENTLQTSLNYLAWNRNEDVLKTGMVLC